METLKTKKITLATLKAFIKNSSELFAEEKASFDGMVDCVMPNKDSKLVPVSKEDALGHKGVYLVGSSRDYFTFVENDNYYGIEVSNSCGYGILWTPKKAN